MRPYVPPITMPFMSTPGINGNAPSPGYNPSAFGGFPGAQSNPFPGPVADQTQGGLFGYEDPRKQAMMAMAASLMASSAPSTTRSSPGAAMGKAHLAGMEARNQQQQLIENARARNKNQEYMDAQIAAMKAAEERRLAIEAAAKGVKFDPTAPKKEQQTQMYQAAAALWAGGDYDKAMEAMAKAEKIYDPAQEEADKADLDYKRALTAQARRGPEARYNYITDDQGNQYMVREGSTDAKPVIGPDGKPLRKGGKGVRERIAEPDSQTMQVTMNEYKQLINWLEKSGEETLGSPGLTMFVDSTYGRLTGSPDYDMQRRLGFVTSGAVLKAAEAMKGALSDRDVKFLVESQPRAGDPIATKVRWLIELHNRMARNLKEDGYTVEEIGGDEAPAQDVKTKYHLEGE